MMYASPFWRFIGTSARTAIHSYFYPIHPALRLGSRILRMLHSDMSEIHRDLSGLLRRWQAGWTVLRSSASLRSSVYGPPTVVVRDIRVKLSESSVRPSLDFKVLLINESPYPIRFDSHVHGFLRYRGEHVPSTPELTDVPDAPIEHGEAAEVGLRLWLTRETAEIVRSTVTPHSVAEFDLTFVHVGAVIDPDKANVRIRLDFKRKSPHWIT
jgi:hypothetical protein